jgi:hypothetical protein
MPKRDITLADKMTLPEQIKNQPLPFYGDNWIAEMYRCMHYTAARETAGRLDITSWKTGTHP